MRLDRIGRVMQVLEAVAAARLRRDRATIEQRSHRGDRLVQPRQALAGAPPELDAMGDVLVFEPRPADAEDGPPPEMWSSVVMLFTTRPGLRKVLAPTIRPSLIRSVAIAHAPRVVYASKIGCCGSPKIAWMWSQVQRLS